MIFEDLKQQVVLQNRSIDVEVLERCYNLANEAHKNQQRVSGEPYIQHPINVALLLLELGLDTPSICAALLHDVVEDTNISLDLIKKQFGEEVALLVDGVTKLGTIAFSSVAEQQAENLRKMLLAMSQDIRVMIIKLCDRLHNMRTLGAMPEQKRRDKALETMEVYAPIAYRLGMKKLKEELEDRSLFYLDEAGYNEIVEALGNTGKTKEYMGCVTQKVEDRLHQNGILDATFESRVKGVYGIYRKMFMGGREFEEIFDIYAIRVIVQNVGECYNVLGVIHDLFHPVPNRFKDYISTPKQNLYRSLHTTVVGPGGTPVEVQIRTTEMHRTAELGVAAHWKYKAGVQGQDRLEERLSWVRQLLEEDGTISDSEEILRSIKNALVPQEVYVFTPRGEVITLPSGATTIDFAYAIHSAVGNRMMGAKIGGKLVPIDHRLVNGEIIEVITGPESKGPNRDWLSIVKTNEARNKIRTWFKKERREENISEGKDALEKELRRSGITIPTAQHEKFLLDIAKRQRLNSIDELYAAIGYGGVLLSRLMLKIKEEYAKLIRSTDPTEAFAIPEKKERQSDGVVVEGLSNCLVKFAKCCSPLPGDEIVGFITRGHGVAIHKQDCHNYYKSNETIEGSARWLSAHWANSIKENFHATLEISSHNRDGMLADITTAFAAMRVPIVALTAKECSDGILAALSITITITDKDHLQTVITRLLKIKDVLEVLRL